MSQADSKKLTTVSTKIPRWVQDVFCQIERDTLLDFSKASREVLTRFGVLFQAHWQKGVTLTAFLDQIDIKSGQYTFFFGEQGKPQKRQIAANTQPEDLPSTGTTGESK